MNGDVQQNSSLISRFLTVGGVSSGAHNMNVNGSVTPVDFRVEARPGERILVSRFIIQVIDSGSFDSGSYGNAIVLTNGIQFFYYVKSLNLTFDITFKEPIKLNTDWNKYCYDVVLSEYGSGNEALSARWTLTKYGSRWGLILNEGDMIGARIRDNLTGLVKQTIMCEGMQLGTQDPDWTIDTIISNPT